MTETLQALNSRITSTEELHSVTHTMASLAAVNLRHYEVAAAALADYEAVIEDGLHIALRDGAIDRLPLDEPGDDARTAVIVFGSNQGLCGPVNRHIASYAITEISNLATVTHIGAVGARMATELELAGVSPGERWDLPGTVEAITARAEQVLVGANHWRAGEGVERILLVFPHFGGRSRGYEPAVVQLAPTDRDMLEWLAVRRWPSKVLPTFTVPWDQLVADLIRQALLVRLHRSMVQTMASVSASRLAAMDGAQHNIEERLIELRKQHHLLRQSEITEELLDVISGFEVLQTE